MAANGAPADAGNKPVAPAGVSAPAPKAPIPHFGRAQVVAPPPSEEAAAPVASFEELAARLGLNADGTPLDPEQPDESDTADEPGTTDPESEQVTTEAHSEEQATPTVDEWAQRIATDPLKHITQVPTKDRVAVLGEIIRRERSSAATVQQAAYADGFKAAQDYARLEAAAAEISELSAEEYGEWAREYPDRAIAYQQFRKAQSAPEQAPVDDRKAVAERIAALGVRQFRRLDDFPEAQQALRARASELVDGESRYAATDTGLQRLIDDVTDALADAKAGRKANDPTRKAAEQRAKSAEERRGLPKADISNAGGGVDSAVTVEQFKTMGVSAHMALRKRDPDQYNRLLKQLAGGA